MPHPIPIKYFESLHNLFIRFLRHQYIIDKSQTILVVQVTSFLNFGKVVIKVMEEKIRCQTKLSKELLYFLSKNSYTLLGTIVVELEYLLNIDFIFNRFYLFWIKLIFSVFYMLILISTIMLILVNLCQLSYWLIRLL